MVRAKFRCNAKDGDVSKGETIRVEFTAVNRGDADGPSDPQNPSSAEDSVFGRFTPWGTVVMGIKNPAASDQFEVGRAYYLDFTAVE